MRGKQGMHTEAALGLKLHSATAYIETFLELYQRKEASLELVQPLQAVLGMLHEIHREVLLQELTRVLHNEELATAERKEKVVIE